MNWVEFEGVTFNLDRVTHFEITEQEDVSEIRAFLNVAHPALQLLDKQDVMGHKLEFQVSIKVAKGTM